LPLNYNPKTWPIALTTTAASPIQSYPYIKWKLKASPTEAWPLEKNRPCGVWLKEFEP
jgi:hypothetical protein